MTKTVLFIHGLESGPHGRKARNLTRAGFTVVSKLMPCSRAQLKRDPPVVGAAVSAAAAAAVSGKAAGLTRLHAYRVYSWRSSTLGDLAGHASGIAP